MTCAKGIGQRSALEYEYEFQGVLMKLRQEYVDQIFILADSTGPFESLIDGYRPGNLFKRTPLSNTSKDFQKLMRRGIETLYSQDLSYAYMCIEELTMYSSFQTFEYETIGQRRFLKIRIPNELKRLIRLIGKPSYNQSPFVKFTYTGDIDLIGHGEYLDACVFNETTVLAEILGVSLEKIGLDWKQPYLRELSDFKKDTFKEPFKSI